MLAGVGVAGTVGSVVIAPSWAVALTVATFAAVVAVLFPRARRVLVGVSIIALVVSAALGIVSMGGDDKPRAQRTPTPSPDAVAAEVRKIGTQLEELSKRQLETRIEQLAAPHVTSLDDEIPLVDLAPTRAAVLEYINRLRDRRGLVRLEASPDLERAAQAHVAEMIKNQSFTHTSASGQSFAERFGPGWKSVGEALAWMTAKDLRKRDPGDTWRQAVEAWLDSGAHRALMYSKTFTHAGVGVDVGTLGFGRAAVYTVDFGTPKS